VRIVKKIFVFILFLILLKLSLSLFFKYIYYPNNPTTYTEYRLKPGYVSGFDPDPNSNEIIMTPPIGGCNSGCQGNKEEVSCKFYSKAYDICEFRCYGNLYNNCQGYWGTIKMLLVN